MLSIKWIRENEHDFRKALQRRGVNLDVTAFLSQESAHRQLLSQLQSLQEERNAIARQIPELKKKGEDATALLARAQEIKSLMPSLEQQEADLREEVEATLYSLPNVLSDDVPEGTSESDNQCLHTWGTPISLPFEPKSHDVLGIQLGMMHFDLASEMSGARFVVLQDKLAKLERALGQFMLDLHTQEHGYTEVSPPLLVRAKAAFSVGQLPKFEEDLFKTTTGHYLISTAEVSLTNLVADQIIPESALPFRYTALTPCFRSEAGAAGRDTKGMIRMHQFYKVELVSVTTPEASQAEHERMVHAAEEVLKRLELPYRVMFLCSGDTGFGSHKTFDLEVWLPSQNTYREVSSCSLFTDFQARRMGARYRPESSGAPTLVHTLNGSGVAVGRALVAILENYQQMDGSIHIPEVLQPYTGFKIIEAQV